MTNEELFALLDRFESSPFSCIEYEDEGFSLKVRRESAPVSASVAAMPVAVATPATVPTAAAVAAPLSASASTVVSSPDAHENELAPTIDAPLVGTFYVASAPGVEPFVKKGSKVAAGETVCLIEAMKMMSEIPAPCDCVIEEVLKGDGEVVSFGEALFRYQPC